MKELDFNGLVLPDFVGDFWYDLTEGGYIKVETIEDEDTRQEVLNAIKVIEKLQSWVISEIGEY